MNNEKPLVPVYNIILNEYQIANLRSALEAAGYCDWSTQVLNNPLYVLQTGDWLGEIYNKLPEVDYQPNESPQVLADRASRWHK